MSPSVSLTHTSRIRWSPHCCFSDSCLMGASFPSGKCDILPGKRYCDLFLSDNDRSPIPDLWAEESVIICWECHVWVFTWTQSSIPLMQLFLIYCLRYCKNPESHYHHRIARRSFTALFKAAVYIFLAQNFLKNIIHNKVYVISVGGGVSWGEGYGLSVFFIIKKN